MNKKEYSKLEFIDQFKALKAYQIDETNKKDFVELINISIKQLEEQSSKAVYDITFPFISLINQISDKPELQSVIFHEFHEEIIEYIFDKRNDMDSRSIDFTLYCLSNVKSFSENNDNDKINLLIDKMNYFIEHNN